MEKIVVEKSDKPAKKFVATVGNKKVYFGQAGFSDFTLHKNPERMERYVSRHSKMGENWGKSGIDTPGFWAKHLLWEKPSLKDAAKNIEKKFNVKVVLRN
jgi:hypothetical protein